MKKIFFILSVLMIVLADVYVMYLAFAYFYDVVTDIKLDYWGGFVNVPCYFVVGSFIIFGGYCAL